MLNVRHWRCLASGEQVTNLEQTPGWTKEAVVCPVVHAVALQVIPSIDL